MSSRLSHPCRTSVFCAVRTCACRPAVLAEARSIERNMRLLAYGCKRSYEWFQGMENVGAGHGSATALMVGATLCGNPGSLTRGRWSSLLHRKGALVPDQALSGLRV